MRETDFLAARDSNEALSVSAEGFTELLQYSGTFRFYTSYNLRIGHQPGYRPDDVKGDRCFLYALFFVNRSPHIFLL